MATGELSYVSTCLYRRIHECLQDYVSPDVLRQTKSQKKLVLTGVSRFNTKPKTGISFLEENKLIYTDPNEPRARSLAAFLKNSTRFDKRLLGDFISKPESIDILKAFVNLFDFKGVRSSKFDILSDVLQLTISIEICSRCDAGLAGDIPSSRGVATDQSNH